MTFHIISLFPEVFERYINSSMLWRAQKEKKAEFKFYNPRDFTNDKHRRADGRPYGGGPGMVLFAEPIIKAAKKAIGRKKKAGAKAKILIMSPAGRQFTDKKAASLAKSGTDIVLIAGHYEGIDARVKKVLKAEEISIGPYTLTGGEVPAMAVMDAVTRRVSGVLGNEESLEDRRVASSEVYTRPEILKHGGKNFRVPKVLLGGHHKDIEKWKLKSRGKKR